MSTISSLRSIENEHDVYKGKDCIKTFFGFLREYIMKTITFKKKKRKLLTKVQEESYENIKIAKEKIKINPWNIKDIVKLEIIVIIKGDIEVLLIAYVI